MKYKLKFILSALLILTMTAATLPTSVVFGDSSSPSAGWPEAPKITSEAAVVIEASTGAILYNKNAFEAYHPASTTKLMTSLLAIEQCPLSDIVTCSRDSVESIGWDSSRIGLVAGESLDMENALYAILLASANEVSYAVGEHVGGTMENFVALMNQRAKDLGCVNTHFVNPHGLDHEDHYSCPYDLALIARKASEYTTFRRVSGSYNHKIPETNKNDARWISNTHPFIKKNVVYKGVFAGKTGTTSKAGSCLVTCAEQNGMTVICAIMKAPNSATIQEDTKKLLDYAFQNFKLTPLAASESSAKNAFPILFDDEEALISDVSSPLSVSNTSLVLPNGVSYNDLTRKVTLSPTIAFSTGNNIIGEVSYYCDDNYIGAANIIYHTETDIVVVPSPTPIPIATPVLTKAPAKSSSSIVDDFAEVSTNLFSDDAESNGRLLLIGIIAGAIVLVVIIYILFIEIPYRRKQRAYKRKYNYRKYNYK